LGKFCDGRAFEPLLKALKDDSGDVRTSAIQALEELGDSRAVESLSQLLNAKEWKVRRIAIKALGKFRDPRSVEPLLHALQNEKYYFKSDYIGSQVVLNSIFDALGDIGEQNPDSLIVMIKNREVSSRMPDVLVNLGKTTIAPLITFMVQQASEFDEPTLEIGLKTLVRLSPTRKQLQPLKTLLLAIIINSASEDLKQKAKELFRNFD